MPPSLLSRRTLSTGLLTLCTALLCACARPPVTENVPPPRIDQIMATPGEAPETMLDWAGSYQAVLPCIDCPGIAIHVQLRADQTALVRERRMGPESSQSLATTYSGPFRFDPPGGSLIHLRSQPQQPAAYTFFVSEGWIELRERNTGAVLQPVATYRLRKTSSPPVDGLAPRD